MISCYNSEFFSFVNICDIYFNFAMSFFKKSAFSYNDIANRNVTLATVIKSKLHNLYERVNLSYTYLGLFFYFFVFTYQIDVKNTWLDISIEVKILD